MKKIAFLSLILLTLFNCNDDTKQDKTPVTKETSTNTSESKTEKNTTKEKTETPAKNKATASISKSQLETTILNFQTCKESATERSDCRNALTAFISKSYELQEFKNKQGDYMIYDSIQPIVKRSKSWKKLGLATNQNNLKKAVKHAEYGGLALIIDTSETFGHVVVVQPGKFTKSNSWGIELPVVFSLSNYNPSKSFHDKILAYAFKKSDDLQVFIRE